MAVTAQKTKKPVKKPAAKAAKKPAGAEAFTPAMGDDAVKAKTGKNWMGWFVILNRANAAAMNHKEIVTLLHGKYDVPGWWAQMITVEFERARGGRKKHEKTDGYSVSASKTLNLPLAKLYALTADAKQRKRWFPETEFVPSSETKDKYLRGSWGKSGARLEIGFYAKGEGKSQIAVQVNKMAKESDVERERKMWKAALEKLTGFLG